MQVPFCCKLNHMSPGLRARGKGRGRESVVRIDEQPVSHDRLAPSWDRRKAIRSSGLRLESQADIYQETVNFSTSAFTPLVLKVDS